MRMILENYVEDVSTPDIYTNSNKGTVIEDDLNDMTCVTKTQI